MQSADTPEPTGHMRTRCDHAGQFIGASRQPRPATAPATSDASRGPGAQPRAAETYATPSTTQKQDQDMNATPHDSGDDSSGRRGWMLSSREQEYQPGADGVPEIVVDVDDSDACIPSVQPGVHDATGGFVAHRIRIRFTTAAAEAATVHFVGTAERGPVPDIEIVLDGRRGVLHPEVERRDRTRTGEPGPVAGAVRVAVPIPVEWLPAGEHELTITTVIDAAAALGEQAGRGHRTLTEPEEWLPPSRSTYGRWFGSYLRWHSIRYVPSDRSEETVPSVLLKPTPFYVRDGAEECELVDLVLSRHPGAPAPDALTISWPGGTITSPPFPGDRDFGQFRFRFPAAGFEGRATFTLTAPGEDRPFRTFDLHPARRWTLRLIPHVHLDLGFTDLQGKVLDLHCRNIDQALDEFDRNPSFRFSVDGSYIVEEYAKTRSPDQVTRLHRAITNGRLGINALHSNPLSGLLTLEEIIHSTDYALTLPIPEEPFGRYANITDVPTHNRAIATVLSKRGINGFVAMSNHGRAATDDSDELHLISPVRWSGTGNTQVLAFFADHYSQLRFLAGDPQSVIGAVNGFERFIARYERDDYLPETLPLIGSHADNEDIGDGDTEFATRWNTAFAWPRITVSTFGEYLQSVEHLWDHLPTWDREMGTYWEDGVGSASATFARYRQTQAQLPAAQTLAVLVAAQNPHLRPALDAFSRAWRDLLIGAEHTITWAHATSYPHASPVADQLEWKAHRITDAKRVATDESRRALAQLAASERLVGPGVIVYNPHPWVADLDAEIELQRGVEILDHDGRAVPYEVLSACNGLRTVRFTVKRLPAHGWRYFPATTMYATLPGGSAEPVTVRSSSESVMSFARRPEDEHSEDVRSQGWHVQLDPATSLPRQITHLRSGRTILNDHALVRFGQLLRTAAAPFDDGAADQLRRPDDEHVHNRARMLSVENFRYVPDPPRDHLVDESPEMRFDGVRATFDGIRLRWRGAGAGLRDIVLELLLKDAGCGEVSVRFDKDPSLDMEGIYVAFPFASDGANLRYDRPLGWVEPAKHHGPGASNAWLAATNGVAVSEGTTTVIWTPHDAPLFTVGDTVRGTWPRTYTPTDGTLYSYVANNAWPCNTPPAQAGLMTFCYTFSIADGFDAAEASTLTRTARLAAMAVSVLPLDNLAIPNAEPAWAEGDLGLAAPIGVTMDVSMTEAGDVVLTVANASDSDAVVALPTDVVSVHGLHAAEPVRLSAGDYYTGVYTRAGTDSGSAV